jgi:hypothetical protein
MSRRFIIFERLDSRQILINQANELLTEAERMPSGVERDRILKRARAIQTEIDVESWANSPGLQPPK